MRLRTLALIGALLSLAQPAAAASITVENLYPEFFTETSFSWWMGDTRVVSSNLVTVPILPDNYVLAPIDVDHPLLSGQSRTWSLPASLDHGFTYGDLVLGGTLPKDSGFSIGPDPVIFVGDPVGLGSTVFDFFWPAVGGGELEIFRVTYASGSDLGVDVGSQPEPVQGTPEPSTGALLLIAGALVLATRWRRGFVVH